MESDLTKIHDSVGGETVVISIVEVSQFIETLQVLRAGQEGERQYWFKNGNSSDNCRTISEYLKKRFQKPQVKNWSTTDNLSYLNCNFPYVHSKVKETIN